MSAPTLDPEIRFRCQRCARCCTTSHPIRLSGDERAAIAARDWSGTGHSARRLFRRTEGGAWALARTRDSRCVLLDDDDRCQLHTRWGEAAKPLACRRFPFEAVAGPEAVHVTADYGCKAVQERLGPPLAARSGWAVLFADALAAVDPTARPSYPLRPGIRASGAEVEAALEGLIAALGDRLAPALARLATFAGAAPPEGRPADAMAIPGPARMAFALTIFADAIDPSRPLDRLQGVFALPRMMGFVHIYRSRHLHRAVAMGQIWRHPGALPAESEALLLSFIRSRLRGRGIFRGVPTAVAGVTRLLLRVDAALYFARALAGDGPLTGEHVLRGLSIMALEFAPARVDSRLPRYWSEPEVALGAAILFAPPSEPPS